jgi:hypothetical protein
MEIFKLFGSIFLKSDEADKTLDKVDKKAQGLDKTLAKMGKSVTNVGKTMSTWVTGPIVAAGAGMLGLATKAGNTADRLLDLASITGMSTDAIQEYQHVAKIAGVNTEAITAAAEGFIKRLPQIQAEGGRASEVLGELGVSVEGTADQIMDNMLVALASIEDPLDRNAKGSQLFGGAWKDLAPILDLGTEGIANAREEAQKMGLVMSNEGLNSANDFRIGMEKLKAQFGAVFLEIGTKMAPVLQDVLIPLVQDKVIPAITLMADKIGSLVEWFSGLNSTTQTVILAIVGVVASIGPLLLIAGKVITIVSKLIPVIKMAGVVIGALTSPIGLTVLAIGALIAIGVLIYKNWDEISAFLKRTWESIKEMATKVFDAVKQAIGQAVDWIVEKIKAFGSAIKKAWAFIWDNIKKITEKPIEGIKRIIKVAMDVIKTVIQIAWKIIRNGIQTATDVIKNTIKLFLSVFRGDWSSAWEAIKNITSAVWNGIINNIKVVVDAIKNTIKIFTTYAKDTLSNLWEGLKGIFKNTFKTMKGFGENIVKGLWQGISDMSEWIRGKVTEFVTSIGSTIKKFFGIASPSKLMAEYGGYIAEGLAVGIEENAGMVADVTRKLGELVTKELDKLGDATIEALKKRYDQEERLQLESLDKQGEALRMQTNRNIREYDRELLAKLKLLDDGTSEEIKALQEQIEGIEGITDREERELKEREYQKRLSQKRDQIAMEQDAENRLKLQNELNTMLADRERKDLLEARKNQINLLRDEIQSVRNNADLKRQEMIKEVEDKKNKQKTLDLITLGGLADEKQAIKSHYNELRKQENIEHQAKLMIANENNKELIDLLESYNPKWLDAGKSFGEKLLEGLNSKKRQIQRTVEQLMYMVGQAGMSVQNQSIRVPALATGGNIQQPGRVLVGERGPEFLDLPRGARVTPLENTGITININNPHLFNERDADRLGQLIVGRLRTATGLRV